MQRDRLAVVVDDVAVGPLDLLEERQELLVPMPRLERRGDLAGGDVQRREQRRGAVPVVVVGAALDPPFLQGQDRHRPVQGLDLGLLIHPQQDRVLGRSQVQPADVGDLPDQLRSVENRNDSAFHGLTP